MREELLHVLQLRLEPDTAGATVRPGAALSDSSESPVRATWVSERSINGMENSDRFPDFWSWFADLVCAGEALIPSHRWAVLGPAAA